MSTSSSLPELVNPIPTEDRKVREWGLRLTTEDVPRADESPRYVEIPGIDINELNAQYGMENAVRPQTHLCTFQVPIGVSAALYAKLRDQALEKWFTAMAKQNWDLYASENYRIKVAPGVYPARDLMTGLAILDRREFQAQAWFRFRNPKPRRIEIDPLWLEPLRIRR